MKAKCVHTIAIGGYRPDICAITLPNLRNYAARIGADFNLITTAKFPGFPASYERLQVHNDGADYEWNIILDADIILHPDFEDPTEHMDPHAVGSTGMMDADKWFTWNKYFERDGRKIGVADCFIVSSWLTHDVWEPLNISFEEAKKALQSEWMVSEYCLSVNVAKYGLKFVGAVADLSKMFHIPSDKDPKHLIKKLQEWQV